jgi:CheY-like chemotaxis protein
MTRILIVEDEAFIALDIGSLMEEATGAETCIAATARAGKDACAAGVDFAFLDVNVRDGTTLELARGLISDNVPLAFLSASNRAGLPTDLRQLPFLSKPYRRKEVLQILQRVFPKPKLKSG